MSEKGKRDKTPIEQLRGAAARVTVVMVVLFFVVNLLLTGWSAGPEVSALCVDIAVLSAVVWLVCAIIAAAKKS